MLFALNEAYKTLTTGTGNSNEVDTFHSGVLQSTNADNQQLQCVLCVT